MTSELDIPGLFGRTVAYDPTLSPTLAYVNLLSVELGGWEYDIVTTAPVGRQVQYDISTGTLTFEMPFTADPQQVFDGQLIHTVYND